MKCFILALTLIPTLALANLDDSAFNGTSSVVDSPEYKTDYSEMVGASIVREDSRLPASDGTNSKKFKFPVDGFDAGTSVE